MLQPFMTFAYVFFRCPLSPIDLTLRLNARTTVWQDALGMTASAQAMLISGVEAHRDDQNRPAWSVISKKLKAAGFDRSAQQARCRFMRMERGRTKREQGKAKNFCKTCGQLRAGHVCTGKPPPPPEAVAAAEALGGRAPTDAVRLDLLAVAAMQNLASGHPLDPSRPA